MSDRWVIGNKKIPLMIKQYVELKMRSGLLFERARVKIET